mmetsp:Transcript_27034/g.79101  ORF Transcript_27034/g.79101 Transcript_27034/m.79101 type:complete len:270 (-) Transcript_27034:1965-2774(-)
MRHLDRLKVAAGELDLPHLPDGDRQRASLRLAPRDAATVPPGQAPHRRRSRRGGGDDGVDGEQDRLPHAAHLDGHVERRKQRLELLPHAGRADADGEKVCSPLLHGREDAARRRDLQPPRHGRRADTPFQRRLLRAADVQQQRARGVLVAGRLGELEDNVGHARGGGGKVGRLCSRLVVEHRDRVDKGRHRASVLGQVGRQVCLGRACGRREGRQARAGGSRQVRDAVAAAEQLCEVLEVCARARHDGLLIRTRGERAARAWIRTASRR